MKNYSLAGMSYAQLVHEGMDAFWIVDATSGIIVETNEAYCKMTGYSEDEVVGAHVCDFDLNHSREDVEKCAQLLKEQKNINLSVVHRAKDGSKIYIDASMVFKEVNGRGFNIGFLRDVTIKHECLEKTKKIQELFMQFADNIDDVFWIRDPDKILFVNQAYEKIWGKDRAELYKDPMRFVSAVVPEDKHKVQAAFASELFDSSHTLDEVFRIKTSSGETRWIHARTVPIYDENGNYTRSTGIAKDITAEKMLSDNLYHMNTQLSQLVKLETHRRMEKERAFGSIFEIMGASVAITNSDGFIVDANKQFLKLFGHETKECVVGKHFCMLLDSQIHDKASSVFDNVKKIVFCSNCTSENCYSSPQEWHVHTASGANLTLLANSAYFTDYKNEVNFIFSMLDITQMRELEKKQKESEKLLIQQGKLAAMGEMIGAIAHQWRQPLNLLGLMVQDIPFAYKNHELDGEYANRVADKAMIQINQMSKTIDDFRNFFRSDKSRVGFSLLEQTKKSLSLVEAMFRSHGIEVVFEVKSDSFVSGFPSELTQVILNIVTNAKDALDCCHRIDKWLKISVDRNDNFGEIRVQDNAGGIPENILGRIFEPYFTTKAPDKGTGIGLFMSKTIIENNMDGYLNAYNFGGGAVFVVGLPLDTQ